MSEKNLRIWLLLGQRKGDNNQLLALGEALDLPFETRTMSYRRTARLRMRLFTVSLGHLKRSSRKWLQPPWPDLVVGIGRRSVPVARWIRRESGERTRIVRLGNPRADPSLFDLVVTTRQYPVRGENVTMLPLAMGRFSKPPEPTSQEEAWLSARPRPHLLLSLGGTAPMWRLSLEVVREVVPKLARRAADAGGSLIVVGSPRTPRQAYGVIREALSGCPNCDVLQDSPVRYPVLLNDADEQFVTADSVSIISEAVMTGKPVGLIPVEPDARGRRTLGPDPEKTRIRDLRRFWTDVQTRGLVGTVEKPTRGAFDNPIETAVAAVRRVLGSLLE